MSYTIVDQQDWTEVLLDGEVTQPEVLEILQHLYGRDPLKQRSDLWQLSNESTVPPLSAFGAIAKSVGSMCGRGLHGRRSAIVAANPFHFAQLDMYRFEARDLPFEVGVFQSHGEAAAWLDADPRKSPAPAPTPSQPVSAVAGGSTGAMPAQPPPPSASPVTTREGCCCPPFDPTPWEQGSVITWRDKRFVRDRVRSLFHIPLNFGAVMRRCMARISAASAEPKPMLVLSEGCSPWGGDVYLEVTRDVPGATMATLSGTFLTKVFEGPYHQGRAWVSEMDAFARSRGTPLKKLYTFYTMCPKCAKAYGRNYVVLFAQIG